MEKGWKRARNSGEERHAAAEEASHDDRGPELVFEGQVLMALHVPVGKLKIEGGAAAALAKRSRAIHAPRTHF